MSSSVFKEIVTSQNDKIDSDLLIVVNKDGSVSVDQTTLHDFLANKDTKNTSVSIVRITSPTPSITDEIEEDEKLNKELFDSLTDRDTNTTLMNSDSPISKETPDNVCLTVEHFYPPDEARKLAAELISFAGIDNPLTVKTYEYARFVVFNDHCYTRITGPEPTSPFISGHEINNSIEEDETPSNNNKSTCINKSENNNRQQKSHSGEHNKSDNNDAENSDSVSIQDDEESDEEESFSSEFSENDRDSDLDFNVNDRLSLRTKKSNRRGRRRKLSNADRRKRQSTSSNISGLDKEMESMFSDDFDSKGDQQSSNRKQRGGKISKNRRNLSISVSTPTTKSKNIGNRKSYSKEKQESKIEPIQVKNVVQNPSSHTTSSPIVTKECQPINPNIILQPYHKSPSIATEVPHKSETIINNQQRSQPILNQNQIPQPVLVPHTIGKALPPLTTIKCTTPQSVPQSNKKRNTNLHVEALFSDMSSLFSTPDIIKKVGVNNPEPQQHKVGMSQTQSINPNSNISNLKGNSSVHSSNSSGGFMALTPISSRNKNSQLPSHISIQTHNSAVELASEQDKQLDLIDSIVKQELAQDNNLPTTQMNADIPNIVKMLENHVEEHDIEDSIFKNVIENHHQPIHNVNISAISLPNSIDLGSSSLLDSLNNQEDGLTEDLLQHVAELVENKNLQEIIDKQVLGVQGASIENTLLSNSINTLTQNNLDMRSNIVIPLSSSSNVNVQPTTSINAISLNKRTYTHKPQLNKSIPGKDLTRKEPIQIMRSDGRIITLPPIEAPTTRGAKRRAQTTPENNATISSPVSKINCSAVNAPADATPNKTLPIMARKNSISGRNSISQSSPLIGELATKDGKNVRRSSTNSTATSEKPLNSVIHDSDDNMDSDESWNSEDDPDRLWCICKQPHNNRFMICCDSCEDWFHGKCVSITKSMGQQMEENGIEWTCPNCIKKKTLGFTVPAPIHATSTKSSEFGTFKKSNEATFLNCIVCQQTARINSIYCSDDCIRKHAQNALVTTKVPATVTPTASSSNQSFSNFQPVTQNTNTVTNITEQKLGVNKIELLPSKIHQTSLDSSNVQMGILRNKNRVIVYERSTGRCLAGNSAPTLSNLKQWLNDNPTFEIVQPGSAQAQAIKIKQQQLKQIAKTMADKKIAQAKALASSSPKSTQTQLKISATNQIGIVNPQKNLNPTSNTTLVQQSKDPIKLVKTTQPTLKQTTLNSNIGISLKAPVPHKTLPVTKISKKPSQDKSSTTTIVSLTSPTPNVNTKEPEPIRINVKRTLKEQLGIRMKETKTDIKLTDEEIEGFANATEIEMFRLFNKDTGTKYKAKYRSLMFNIKDRKNTTLFQKICDKSIEPKQLVRMSPEELASQELAQWRENENKHQLEMIKKSELDLLACAKNYVLKTHKGEEVIEGKLTDRLELDPTVAVEDVVTMLNNSTVSSTSDSFVNTPKNRFDVKLEQKISKDYELGKDYTGTNSNSNKQSSSSASAKKKDSRRSRSRDKHESSRTKSSKYKKHKSRERRSRSRDNRDKEKNRDTERRSRSKEHIKRSKSRDKDRDRDNIKYSKDSRKNKEKTVSKPEKIKNSKQVKDNTTLKNIKELGTNSQNTKTPSNKDINKTNSVENYNLVDKILEASSSSSSVQINEIKMKEKSKGNNITTLPEIIKKSISVESDQEPTSTVIIPTPPDNFLESDNEFNQENLWSGNISMIDVATFHVELNTVSGECDDIKNDLPTCLEIVGRISPETVWDYITKIKKSPNKEILLLRFESSIDSGPYNILYQYLYTRKRLGVIKTNSPFIKDFYVLPLCSTVNLPNVLLPITGPGFVEDVVKLDLLVGIIVKIKGKRSAPPLTNPSSSKMRKLNSPTLSKTQIISEERFTPPNSPKEIIKLKASSKLTQGLPKSNNLDLQSSKGDEPYSPGGSDDDELMAPIISSMQMPNLVTKSILVQSSTFEQDDLQRKMDQLNKEIEAQKLEIAGILTKTNPEMDEPYSPSKPVSPSRNLSTLANIAIPSNLQEILASIKSAPPPPPPPPIIDLDPQSPQTKIPGIGDSMDEEYNPSLPSVETSLFSKGRYQPAASLTSSELTTLSQNNTSKLAQLSEAELLSMVPDDIDLENNKDSQNDNNSSLSIKSTWETSEPPPPGLEDEYSPV